MRLKWCPGHTSSRGCITSTQPQKKSSPCLVRKHTHPPLALSKRGDMFFFFFFCCWMGKWSEGKLEEVVMVEGWKSLVTLHVPVCACLHLWLSSHLTGLSVSTADQNASLSLTGWTNSATIQTDSYSSSWWRDGGMEGWRREENLGDERQEENNTSVTRGVNEVKSVVMSDCERTLCVWVTVTFKPPIKVGNPPSVEETQGASLSIFK